ncbi:MAG TPA: hypothetical protein VIK04_18020 [Solirubrobacteraceae bacterium]
MTWACSTTVLGWVEVVDDEVRDEVDRLAVERVLAALRRAVVFVPAALRRAVVFVLRAAVLVALAPLRAVVFAVVAAAFAVDAGFGVPVLAVVAISGFTPLQSLYKMVAGSLAIIEHMFVNRRRRSVTFPSTP